MFECEEFWTTWLEDDYWLELPISQECISNDVDITPFQLISHSRGTTYLCPKNWVVA